MRKKSTVCRKGVEERDCVDIESGESRLGVANGTFTSVIMQTARCRARLASWKSSHPW
jgi:hypothetical protein